MAWIVRVTLSDPMTATVITESRATGVLSSLDTENDRTIARDLAVGTVEALRDALTSLLLGRPLQ